MEKKHFLLIVIILVLFSAIFLRIKARIDNQNSLSKIEKSTVASVAIIEDNAEEVFNFIEPEDKNSEPEDKNSEIKSWESSREVDVLISRPQSGSFVSSPLLVQGKVSGAWFFEASLPIRLIDEEGKVIANSYAMTEEDWMTEAPVSFSGVLNFLPEVISSDTGYLLILKDNPSGLPENDGVIRMPVRFK